MSFFGGLKLTRPAGKKKQGSDSARSAPSSLEKRNAKGSGGRAKRAALRTNRLIKENQDDGDFWETLEKSTTSTTAGAEQLSPYSMLKRQEQQRAASASNAERTQPVLVVPPFFAGTGPSGARPLPQLSPYSMMKRQDQVNHCRVNQETPDAPSPPGAEALSAGFRLGECNPEAESKVAQTGPVAALRMIKASNLPRQQAFAEQPKQKVLVAPPSYIPTLATDEEVAAGQVYRAPVIVKDDPYANILKTLGKKIDRVGRSPRDNSSTTASVLINTLTGADEKKAQQEIKELQQLVGGGDPYRKLKKQIKKEQNQSKLNDAALTAEDIDKELAHAMQEMEVMRKRRKEDLKTLQTIRSQRLRDETELEKRMATRISWAEEKKELQDNLDMAFVSLQASHSKNQVMAAEIATLKKENEHLLEDVARHKNIAILQSAPSPRQTKPADTMLILADIDTETAPREDLVAFVSRLKTALTESREDAMRRHGEARRAKALASELLERKMSELARSPHQLSEETKKMIAVANGRIKELEEEAHLTMQVLKDRIKRVEKESCEFYVNYKLLKRRLDEIKKSSANSPERMAATMSSPTTIR